MGKARKFSGSDDEAVLQSQSDSENYAVGAQQNAQNLGSVHFSDNSGYGNFTQAGRDQRNAALDGALFRGNIGFNLQICKLDVGTETIDILSDGFNPLSVVSTDKIVTLSAGVTGDLTTILGAQRPGQRLLLYGIQGNTITIKNTAAATENTILTPDGTDFTLENTNVALLVYDITTTKWRVLSGGGSGGGSTLTTWREPARVGLIGFNFFYPFIQEVEDGVTLVPGDRVLQTAELNPIFNGLFEVVGPLIPGVPNLYLLVRPADFLGGSQALSESFVAIEEGTLNAKKVFHLTDANPISINTDPQTWEEFGAGGLQDPIILNENDLGTIGFLNQLIDWSTNNFYRAELNGDISITMQNLPVSGKWEQLIIELTQDAVGGHTVTFLDIFANGVTPKINPGINSKSTLIFYAYNDGSNVILAFDVNSNFTEFPEFDHGTVGPAALNIDWGVANFQRMVLAGDVTITHVNLPTPGNWQQMVIEYTQDIPAGHDVLYTQSFGNGVVPTINLGSTVKTTTVFYAYNTGVITVILAFDTTTQSQYIHAIKAANQPAPLTVTTHAEFDTVTMQNGISVSTGAGQLSGIFSGFKVGRTYELECFIGIRNIIPSSLGYCWVDINNGGLFIGSRGFVHTMDNPGLFESSQPSAKAIFTPVANTDTVEVQFTSNSDLAGNTLLGSLIGQPESYVVIKEI